MQWSSVALIWSLVSAAEPPMPIELAPVDVPLPPRQLEATPSSPLKRDPTGAITVLPIRPAQAQDAAAVLAESPGAVIQDSGGAGQRKTLSLRGAAPNAVLVLLDGVPLTGPGGSMDLSRIPTAALDRVEVLRGATGARYGPGAMGGVVNLVTKTPDGSKLFGAASHGSFATTQLSLGGSASLLGGDGLLLLHGLRSQGDYTFGYNQTPSLTGSQLTTLRRENNQALRGGGLFRYRTHLKATSLDAVLEGTTEQRGLAGTVQNPTVDATQSTTRGTASVRTLHGLDGNGELSVLGWGRLDGTTLRGSFFGPGYQQLESAVGAEVVATRLVAERHGVTGLISGGGEFLSEPSGQNPRWRRLGLMLADEVLFFDGALAVTGVVRFDLAGPFAVFSPKLGLSLQLPLGFELKGNVGQASRPPGFFELYVVQGTLSPNPSLRPERALTADVTVSTKHERWAAGVTAFGSLYEDLISYEYYPPGLAKPYNFQAARVGGLEVEASAAPVSWLSGTLAYTFMASQNLKDDPRYYLKQLPNRPAHRVSARIVAGLPFFSVHGEVLAQSAQFLNRTETLGLPARAFVNAGIASTPWKNPALTVSIDVKNLLDVQTQDLDGYPLPPRAAFVSLAFAWDAEKK